MSENNGKWGLFGLFKKKNKDVNDNSVSNETAPESMKADDVESKNDIDEKFDFLKINEDSKIFTLWNYITGKNFSEFDPLEFSLNELKAIADKNQDGSYNEIAMLITGIETVSETIYNKMIIRQETQNLDDFQNLDSANTRFSSLKAFGGSDVQYNKSDVQNIDTVNAYIFTDVSDDKMYAWIFVYPPSKGGSDITEKEIRDELGKKGIVYGIDEEMVKVIAERKLYFKLICIAKGIPMKESVDGEVIYIIPIENDMSLLENEDGTVNYKELNLIKSVKKGDKICEIINPVDGTNGINIYGKEIIARKGRKVHIPKGKNTKISDDGKYLEAAMDGHISFVNGVYNIQNLITIDGDVDVTTGNITFTGDVMIKGSIREGFSVKADGSIRVMGNVETGTTVISQSNITVDGGINGGPRGFIEAKGIIKTKYIENCRVRAGSKIDTEVIIDSEIECDDTLRVMQGRGIIRGGKLTIGKQIEARVIGNEKNLSCSTEIVLGLMPNLVREREQIRKQIIELSTAIEKLVANVTYLTKLEKKLDSERKLLLSQLRLQLNMRNMEKDRLIKQYEAMNSEIEKIDYCRLKADVIYPLTTITIGHEVQTIHETIKGVNKGVNPQKQK